MGKKTKDDVYYEWVHETFYRKSHQCTFRFITCNIWSSCHQSCFVPWLKAHSFQPNVKGMLSNTSSFSLFWRRHWKRSDSPLQQVEAAVGDFIYHQNHTFFLSKGFMKLIKWYLSLYLTGIKEELYIFFEFMLYFLKMFWTKIWTIPGI